MKFMEFTGLFKPDESPVYELMGENAPLSECNSAKICINIERITMFNPFDSSNNQVSVRFDSGDSVVIDMEYRQFKYLVGGSYEI